MAKETIAITGAAGGIGRAIAKKYIQTGARVAISDLNEELVIQTAKEIGAQGYYCNVAKEDSVEKFIHAVQADIGSIDVFVSNAGVGFPDQPGGHAAGGSDESWELSWQVNLMSNVYAGRHLIPDWIENKTGRFVVVASAAGLLSQVGTASYTVTKHAAVGYAEYMAIMHKDDGIKVNCVCPQYVKTNMTKGMTVVQEGPNKHIEASDVADSLFAAIAADEFLVLPHPIIGDYFQAKAVSHDRYIRGMAMLKTGMESGHIHKMGGNNGKRKN
ncbi:MAG: SDR family NAD(P)-dependent oxidoreductase [Robiginitomaculum sp.]